MSAMPADPASLSTEFTRRGFLPAMPLLDEPAISYLRSLRIGEADIAAANSRKSLWRSDRRVLDMARQPNIAKVLDALFDERGYFLWGAQLIDRQPGEGHHWHSDIETAADGFVSLWIGIDGLSEANSLRVLPGSHTLTEPLQAHFPFESLARQDPAGSDLVRHAARQGVTCDVAMPGCAAGEGIFFHGRLWHGTFNSGSGRRRSLLLQFGRCDRAVRHYRDRTRYPFQYDEVNVPTVLALRGAPDPVINPSLSIDEAGHLAPPVARTCAAPQLRVSGEQDWARVPYFDTDTPIMQHLRCHASILRGGAMPHLPHRHDDEELLVVLSGSAGIVTRGQSPGEWKVKPASAGDVFYYPCGFEHTIQNRSLGSDAQPLVYVMFRWRVRDADIEPAPVAHIPARAVRGSKRVSLDRPASRLAKLHVHTTQLEPGQRFARHIDRYDSTFVVLRGELSVMGQTLGPGGVFLTRAGELHNTENLGTEPCKYLVFEFHSRRAAAQSGTGPA